MAYTLVVFILALLVNTFTALRPNGRGALLARPVTLFSGPVSCEHFCAVCSIEAPVPVLTCLWGLITLRTCGDIITETPISECKMSAAPAARRRQFLAKRSNRVRVSPAQRRHAERLAKNASQPPTAKRIGWGVKLI